MWYYISTPSQMENTYINLAEYLKEKLSSLPPERRFLLAIAGIPGSGKTTLTKKIEERVNELIGRQIAISVSMDGYHYPMKTLDTFSNAEEARKRRGAHWTFDAEGLHQLVISIRNNPQNIIYAPSFDHSVGDPKENDISIFPSHQLVILEGLYLHLKELPWGSIASQMDELWFLQVDREKSRSRVIERHIRSGICNDKEAATRRADENDFINANYILSNSMPPTKTIYDIEDD